MNSDFPTLGFPLAPVGLLFLCACVKRTDGVFQTACLHHRVCRTRPVQAETEAEANQHKPTNSGLFSA